MAQKVRVLFIRYLYVETIQLKRTNHIQQESLRRFWCTNEYEGVSGITVSNVTMWVILSSEQASAASIPPSKMFCFIKDTSIFWDKLILEEEMNWQLLFVIKKVIFFHKSWDIISYINKCFNSLNTWKIITCIKGTPSLKFFFEKY